MQLYSSVLAADRVGAGAIPTRNSAGQGRAVRYLLWSIDREYHGGKQPAQPQARSEGSGDAPRGRRHCGSRGSLLLSSTRYHQDQGETVN